MKDFIEDDSMRIVNNIRLIRDYKGDTRRVLSEELSIYGKFSIETIKKYENGGRPVQEAYIIAISKLYGIPTKLIKEQTLTNEILKEFDKTFDIFEYKDIFSIMFDTSASSEEARKDNDFIKATEIKNCIKERKYTAEMPSIARNLYFKSFEEKGFFAGASNAIMMLFFEYSMLTSYEDLEDKLSKKLLTIGQFYSEFIRRREINLEKRTFLKETYDILEKCIVALATTYKGRIYAEYYMALKYLMCMIDNDRPYRENAEIGRIMMLELSKIGNPLAKKIVEKLDL